MTDDAKDGSPAKDSREARLAAALRANLRRRKAQTRARRSGERQNPGERDDQD